MNIFALSYDPIEAATLLCDKHVTKMGLEAVQMMSTALYLCGSTGIQYDASQWKDRWDDPARSQYIRAYKPTHASHPCTRWTCAIINYNWLRKHAEALFNEHVIRYGTRPHTSRVLEQLPRFPEIQGPIRFVLAMPDHLKCDDPIQSYRRYYRADKANIAKWTNRPIPEWMK